MGVGAEGPVLAWAGTVLLTFRGGAEATVASVGVDSPPCDVWRSASPYVTCRGNPFLLPDVPLRAADAHGPVGLCLRFVRAEIDVNGDGAADFAARASPSRQAVRADDDGARP